MTFMTTTDVAQALADRFADVDGVAATLPYEPKQAPDMPLVTAMFSGFGRSGLETSRVEGELRDPLGGRLWIWRYKVRLWCDLSADEEAAQGEVRQLVPDLVRALEEEPRFLAELASGGFTPPALDDSAMVAGVQAIARTEGGHTVLLFDMECLVEVTEPT